MLAIIGGTGLTQLSNLEITHRQVMRTPLRRAFRRADFRH